MAIDLLNRPAPADESNYKETGQRMSELLSDKGWCMVKCSNLGGDVIVVVIADCIKGYPMGYPVYTEAELAALTSSDRSTMQLLHEAKKEGAKIEEVNV